MNDAILKLEVDFVTLKQALEMRDIKIGVVTRKK